MASLTQVINRLCTQYGIGTLIASGEIASIGNTSLTITPFINTNWGGAHFLQNEYIVHRYQATDAGDVIRYASEFMPATGALAVAGGANYVDQTAAGEALRLIKWGLHPTHDILPAINLAQEQIGARDLMALSLAADASQWSSATSSYTESDSDGGPAATLSKVTTAGQNIFPGQRRGGRVLNAAANGYIRQRFNVTRGEQIYTGVFVRADVGEFKLKWQDVSNSVELGTAISTTEETWQYVHRQESVTGGDSGTEILEVRLQPVGTTDDAYFGPFFVYRLSQARMVLPSDITEEYQIEALTYGTFSRNTASGVEDAMSLETIEVPHDDYGFFFGQGQGQQNFIQFHNGSHEKWLRYPLFLQVRLPDSAVTTLTAEADTTNIPLHLIVPQVMLNLCDSVGGKLQNRDELELKAARDLDRALGPRRVSGPAQRKARSVRFKVPS